MCCNYISYGSIVVFFSKKIIITGWNNMNHDEKVLNPEKCHRQNGRSEINQTRENCISVFCSGW